MKKFTAILLLSAFVLCGSVTFASDVGKYKVPKNDISMSYELATLNYNFEVPADEAGFKNFLYSYNGIIADAVLVPTNNNFAFLETDKPVYRAPFVDKKWIWCYSTYYNI